MKRPRHLFAGCLLLLILSFAAGEALLAHSGRTDAAGGHYDRRFGGYHFHHGMGPHQHPNGVCPYRPGGRLSAADNRSFVDRHPVLTLVGAGAAVWAVRKLVQKSNV